MDRAAVAVSSTAAAARAFVDCDIGGRPLDRMSEAAGVGQRGDHVGVSSIAGSFRTQCANAGWPVSSSPLSQSAVSNAAPLWPRQAATACQHQAERRRGGGARAWHTAKPALGGGGLLRKSATLVRPKCKHTCLSTTAVARRAVARGVTRNASIPRRCTRQPVLFGQRALLVCTRRIVDRTVAECLRGCRGASAAVGARCAVGAVNAEGVRQPLIREHPPQRINSDEKRGQMRVGSSPSLVPVEQWAPTRSRES